MSMPGSRDVQLGAGRGGGERRRDSAGDRERRGGVLKTESGVEEQAGLRQCKRQNAKPSDSKRDCGVK